MSAIGRYVLTLVCASLICAIVLTLGAPSGAGYRLRKMICGIFLAFIAISPLKEVDFRDFSQEFREYSQEAESASSLGQNQAEAAILDIIKSRCGSYILDKAAELGISLRVEVEVDPKTFLPTAAAMEGEFTPYQKQVLSGDIARELGIEKEAQSWNRH